MQNVERLAGRLHGGAAPQVPFVEIDEPHDFLTADSCRRIDGVLEDVHQVPDLLVVVLRVLQREGSLRSNSFGMVKAN